MNDAINRHPDPSSLAPTRRGGEHDLAAIPRSYVSAKLEGGIRTMAGTLPLNSHDVDARTDRRLFHRSRWNDPGTPNTCHTLVDCRPQTRLPQRAGGPSRRHASESRQQSASARSKPLSDCGTPRRWQGKLRRGQALLEFAILVPVIVLLIGATISFGLFFFQANVLQQAVDVAAQEISRMPFEPNQELGLGRLDMCDRQDMVCSNQAFKERIYDEQFLVIHDREWDGSTEFNGDFQAFADQLPLLNRLMVPSMIRDNGLTRYPGTIVVNTATGEETVLIPIVEYRLRDIADSLPFPNHDPPTGGFVPSAIRTAGETVCQWVAPVEEIRVDHDGDETSPRKGPYTLDSADDATLESFEPGMVALRINYPAQSTTLINRATAANQDSDPDGYLGRVIVVVGDTDVKTGATTGCYRIQGPTPRISPATNLPGSNSNAGLYGLGELEALTRIVRPYRKVMSFQAIYRREVFADGI